MSGPSSRLVGRGLLVPGLFAAGGIAVLAGLGFWQLERRDWKEALIARIEARTRLPAVGLPPATQWSESFAETWEYRAVTVRGRLDTARAVLVHTSLPEPRGGPHRGPGYFVLSPLAVAGGGTVIVNRGFVPETLVRDEARWHGAPGEVTATGLLRRAEDRNMFTPADDAARKLLFVRDHAAAARLLGVADAAPFSLDLTSPKSPTGLPQGGETRVALPNKHLGYALTWFGLAAALAGVFALFAWRRLSG